MALPIVSVACAGDLTEEEKAPFRTAGKGGASTGGAGAEGGPGGSGALGGSGGSGGSAGSGGASLDLCVVPLFKAKSCATDGCHGGMPVQAGLVLTDTVLTQPGPLLVNKLNMGVTGACEPGMFKLIDSAEPEKSLIYTKLTTPPCGSKMPVVPPYVTATEAACVLSWIKSIPGVGPVGGSGGAGGAGSAGGGAGSSGAGGAGGTTEAGARGGD